MNFILGNGEKYALVDENGEELCEYLYDEIKPLYGSAKLFRTWIVGMKYGIIDCNGHEVLPCEYDWIFSYDSGSARIAELSKDGKRGGMNLDTYKIVVPCEYDVVSHVSLGDKYVFQVTHNEKSGIIDAQTGEELLEREYDPSKVHAFLNNPFYNGDLWSQIKNVKLIDYIIQARTIQLRKLIDSAKTKEEITKIVKKYKPLIEKAQARKQEIIEAQIAQLNSDNELDALKQSL